MKLPRMQHVALFVALGCLAFVTWHPPSDGARVFRGELAGACGLFSEAGKVPGSLLALRGFDTGDWICSRSEGVGLAQVKSDSVPEPGTILLVAFGIVVMLGRFRGRMRR